MAIAWGSIITDLRGKSGMTLAEIGTAVGLSQSAVSDIEQGRTSEPRGEAALRLYSLHRERCTLEDVTEG